VVAYLARQASMEFCSEVVFLVLFLLSANAQAEFSFYTSRPSKTFSYHLVESYEKQKDQFLTFNYQWLNAPVLSFTQINPAQSVLVDDVSLFELGYAKNLNADWRFGFDLGYFSMKFNNVKSQGGLNDLRLTAKYQPGEKRDMNFAVLYELYAPTGNSNLLLSSHGAGAGGLGVFSYTHGANEWSINLGLRYMLQAEYQGIDRTLQVPVLFGLKHEFDDNLNLNLETYANYYPNSSYKNSDGETLLAIFRRFSSMQFGLGGGFGSTDSEPEAQYRVFASLKVELEKEKPVQVKTVEIRTIEKVKDCSNYPLSLSYSARPLSKQEMKDLKELPYSLPEGSAKLLNYGEMSASEKGENPEVRNSLVVAAIDIYDLPPREWIQKVKSAVIGFSASVLKDSRREVFCFIGKNVCSGELNRGGEKGAINEKFFRGRDTPNDYYMRQLLKKARTQKLAHFRADMSLNVESLLENSMTESALELIYDRDLVREDGSRTLYVVMAGNTYIKPDLKINLNITVNNCGGGLHEN
jgi:hypothetical protein